MADGGLTLFLIPLLVVIGFIGFFVIIITLILRFIGKSIRTLFGKPQDATRHGSGTMRPCGHVRCGHFNPLAARYCARCGRRLNSWPKGAAHE